MKLIDVYIEKVTKTLKDAGRYAPALDLQIISIASEFVTLEMANKEISNLDSVLIDSPQGKKPHPAFGIQKDAAHSITRQLKSLGLVAEMLGDEVDSDPLAELTQKVIEASKGRRKTVKPLKS